MRLRFFIHATESADDMLLHLVQRPLHCRLIKPQQRIRCDVERLTKQADLIQIGAGYPLFSIGYCVCLYIHPKGQIALQPILAFPQMRQLISESLLCHFHHLDHRIPQSLIL